MLHDLSMIRGMTLRIVFDYVARSKGRAGGKNG